MKLLKVYTDGGSRGNPGEAACGILIFDESNYLVDFDVFCIGFATNNQAEYKAFYKASKLVAKLNPESAEFHLDSELVVKQLNGEYKIKDTNLKQIIKEINSELKKIKKYKIIHIRREQNKFADKLVNIALDISLNKAE